MYIERKDNGVEESIYIAVYRYIYIYLLVRKEKFRKKVFISKVEPSSSKFLASDFKQFNTAISPQQGLISAFSFKRIKAV